jgi:hypothetical protein
MPSTTRLASGVAMLTAAAGLAYKHRDKLTALLKRDGSDDTTVSALPAGTPEPAPRPATAGAGNNWTDDPARTAATSDTATRADTVVSEPAAEESPWVSPAPPSGTSSPAGAETSGTSSPAGAETSGTSSPAGAEGTGGDEAAEAGAQPAQATQDTGAERERTTPADPRTESPPASSGEESPWVSPQPPKDESPWVSPQPPGEER